MASGVTSSAVFTGSGVANAAGTINGIKSTQTLMGYSIRATAAAVVKIREGSATGKVLADIAILINDDKDRWYGPQGKRCDGDLYVEVVSGTVEGILHIG